MDATISAVARLPVTFDRDCRQANRPLNQLKLTWGGVARNTTVHLQRTKLFAVILGNDDYGKEAIQTKEHCAVQNFSAANRVLVWHGDQGYHIPYLTIQSVTDIVQNF